MCLMNIFWSYNYVFNLYCYSNKCHITPYITTISFFFSLKTMFSSLIYVHLACCFWLLHGTQACVTTAFCLFILSNGLPDCSQVLTITNNAAIYRRDCVPLLSCVWICLRYLLFEIHLFEIPSRTTEQ